ncbi:MAG: DUF3619 family protein [Methylotenera sp.]|uniref:DUF3619 family protein n=1 Tax=Methylotenera sp. TaxID=2051956 RepID=UPI002487F1D2|nr:DUF3619 family protein [Methylotenera sp.]MDI1309188.1 DUF3619 family protein [Methylotenera sp.]
MDNLKDMQNSKINKNNVNDNLLGDEQLAKLAANLLNDNAQHLNAVTLKRLSEMRGLAVSKLETSLAINQNGNVLQWVRHGFGSYFEQHRWMSAAIIISAMLLTFLAAQKFNIDNNLENSDAFLLASELPPEAFADKGFDTWLVSKRD